MRKFSEIKTRNELADFLHIPRKRLSYILYIKGINNLYTSFEIPKKNGGVRKISAPLEELKSIQRKLAKAIYENMKTKWKKNNISHAFIKDKSIMTNAEIHRNKKIVLNIDLEDFFESIHFGRVRGFFNKNKNFLLPLEVATVIAQLTCYEGKLPQGAPSSPIISNLICEILDYRLLKIAKKYKLNYTRYADDLTFSTNDKNFLQLQNEFYKELSYELERAGFKINETKKRLQFCNSRQMVTGLVVNKEINVIRNYYKETRAMAHRLYKQGSFEINGEPATINQLEGRFAFINQIYWFNNKIDGKKHYFSDLKSSKERQYQKFLFYKYFYANTKPLIVTEGKTDVVYLMAALKNLYNEYPKLITKNNDGTFDFKVSFLKRTKRLQYFLGIFKDGADTLKNIYSFYDSKRDTPNYFSYFTEVCKVLPKNPVILMFDNEIESGKRKPIRNFLNTVKLDEQKSKILKNEYKVNLIGNLYVLTVPLIRGNSECEIEDLFDENTLTHKIDGKVFTKKDKYDKSRYYGKEIFSKYISNNYLKINFNDFRPLLDNIVNIIDMYQSGHDLAERSISNVNISKVPLEI
jgi:hypothetical protein